MNIHDHNVTVKIFIHQNQKINDRQKSKKGSLGYHFQTGNKDSLLSIDFGMREWGEFDSQEIVRKYREFVYETGAVDRD